MKEEFKIQTVSQRGGSEISGTKTRQAIKDNDFESFKSMTHKSVHPFFKEMQKYLK